VSAQKKSAAKPKIHAHGCSRCDTRYEDVCGTPAVDGLCVACQGGRPWQLLIDSRAWRACCVAVRRTTKEERERYRLAGNPKRTWWICADCKRTQVYRPKPKEDGID
jgi:hypothetical protein